MKMEIERKAAEVNAKIDELEIMIDRCEHDLREAKEGKGGSALLCMVTVVSSIYLKFVKLAAKSLRSKINV